MLTGINPELVKLASYANGRRQKRAFVPSDVVAGGGGGGGGPPGGGGGPPPGGGGGPPPGGGGGPPPGDPPPGGGTGGPMPGGVDVMSALPQMIQQGVSQAMQQSGMQGQPGVAGTGTPGKPAKPDINTVAMDVFQMKKMFLHYLKMQGVDLPPDILDGPNRDPSTGMPTPPDPSAGLAGGGGGGAGPQSAIPPISPMQGAFPSAPGGAGKTASDGALANAHAALYKFAASLIETERNLVKMAKAYGTPLDPACDPTSLPWPVCETGRRFEPRVGEEVNGHQVISKAAAIARMCRQRAGEKA